MSQGPQSDPQSSQSDVPPVVLNNTQDPLSAIYSRQISSQEPVPIIHYRGVGIQEPVPIIHSRRVSIQDPVPIIHSRRVSIQASPPSLSNRLESIQEPPPALSGRRVSIQEPPGFSSRRFGTQEPPSGLSGRRVSIQEPPVLSGRRVSIQEPPPGLSSRRVSIQEPSVLSGRRVSIQEPPPGLSGRRVSIQEPQVLSGRRVSIQEPPVLSGRRVSIQEPPPVLSGRRVSIQEPPPVLSGRRVSIQEPPVLSGRRVSIQEPPPALSGRRVSIQEPPALSGRRVSAQEPPPDFSSYGVSTQEPPPDFSSYRVSTQEPPPDFSSYKVSTQEPLPYFSSRRVSTQEPLQIIYGRWANARDTQSITCTSHFSTRANSTASQMRQLSIQRSHPLAKIESVTCQDYSTTQTPCLSIRSSVSQTRSSVNVPPSITHSPEASIESIKSAFWDSKDNVKECVHSSQFNQSTPDDIHNFSLGNSIRTSSGWSQKYSRLSLLSINWWLLHEAKKISRQVSLVLNLSSLVLIGLISLGQPWIHFQVPLTSSWDPAGFQTIPITTILFVRCPDISCMHEYDQNAYLLDLSWAFLLFSSIASLCLCFGLIGTIFLTNFYLPMLDFFFFITSILAGTSIVLSILFYLLQAHEYLQEGMTYQLGRSFYLAWTGVFLFLMTGLLSYLNYMNFWSIWLTRSFGFRTKECVRRPASMALHQAPRDPTRPKSLL